MGNQPLVSAITITFDRPQFLPLIYHYVKNQTYRPLEWIVVDDSPTPSRFMENLSDRWVKYIYLDHRLSTGLKRNYAIEQASGEIIANMDDDDYYAPHYIETMVNQLKPDLGLIFLNKWYVYHLVHQQLAFWDTTQITGEAIEFSQNKMVKWKFSEQDNLAWQEHLSGAYGFCFVHWRNVFPEAKYSDKRWNSDHDFIISIRNKRLVQGVADTSGLSLHLQHAVNVSKCLPQTLLSQESLNDIFPDFDLQQYLA